MAAHCLWVLYLALYPLITEGTGVTDVTTPANFSSFVFLHGGIDTKTSTSAGAQHTIKSSTMTTQTSQRLEHAGTDGRGDFSRPVLQNKPEVTHHNVSMAAFNLAECGHPPDLKNITIENTNGYMFYQSKNENKTKKCVINLRVPRHKIAKLQINLCLGMTLEITNFFSATHKIVFPIRCRYKRSFFSVYSLTARIAMVFRFYKMRKTNLSLYFLPVNESERPALELISEDSSSGYVQTPGWNGVTQYPPLMISCATLTPPIGHVIFLSFLSMKFSKGDDLFYYPDQCGSKQKYTKLRSVAVKSKQKPIKLFRSQKSIPESSLFPDDFFDNEKQEIISLSLLFVSNDNYQHSGFRLRYSFYSEDRKPERVIAPKAKDDTKWNCSMSVWPGLSQHFPCNLIPECAESEDEAACPYTSEKCGLDKVEAGKRCYIYRKRRTQNWFDSDRKCRQLGGLLVSLETYQKWNDIMKLLEHSVEFMVWIGLTQQNTGKASVNRMYRNTWQWESGSTAYHLSLRTRIYDYNSVCAALHLQPINVLATTEAHIKNCEGSVSASILCELPLSSDHRHTSKPVKLSVSRVPTKSRVPLVTCPLKHMVHGMLACDPDSLCRKAGINEAWNSGDCKMTFGLAQPYFYCGVPGEYISYSLVCDYREDCSGGGDEDFCAHPPCKGHMLNCGRGQCVDPEKLCDGHKDCSTNLDESGCPNTPTKYDRIKPLAVVNFDRPGRFSIIPLPENTTQCPDTHFRCPDGGYCLPVYVRCNEVNDCPGHEDEMWCNQYRCPGFYRCRGNGRNVCVHANHLCDGWPQCPLHDDELMCSMTCPVSCTCSGLAFTCPHTFHVSSFPQLRYLEARGSQLSQADVTNNLMLIHLGVQACGWSNLTDFKLFNLHILDLSDNLLHHINFSHFVPMHQLQRLNLAGNPISRSLSDDQRQYVQPLLAVFNLSRVRSDFLNMTILSAVMPDIQVLDLSFSGVQSLKGQRLFQTLRVLDLRGSLVSNFTPDFMKSMNSLDRVFADNFKLCCPTVLPDIFRGECLAPSDGISSCNDLLKSNIYRLALAVFAVLAIVGNFGSFTYRLCSSPGKMKIGFAVFVIHLCISDFLMGLYLSFIGLADRFYAGVYVWSETAWKWSAVCSVAGFLSFVSSEVSAFMICLITLDRFIVLHFPFSQFRFGGTSAHIACVIVWVLGITLAAIPLLPTQSHWGFYHQTGICIPLPVTRVDFAGQGYSFGVMIVCNLILFVLIAVGQALIYWSVRSNAMSEQRAKEQNKGNEGVVKSREIVIARRLLSITITDFLCWFPIGLCGLLAAVDVVISEKVNVAMAILVLPLNSALNPFIYTLNVILEKRQKAHELRFQQFLHAYMKKGLMNSVTSK